MQSDQEKTSQQVEEQKSENFVSLYANTAKVENTFFDFKIIFGQILNASEQTLVVEHLASVIMSPQHAKTFHSILTDQMKRYEEKFGPIVLPAAATTANP